MWGGESCRSRQCYSIDEAIASGSIPTRKCQSTSTRVNASSLTLCISPVALASSSGPTYVRLSRVTSARLRSASLIRLPFQFAKDNVTELTDDAPVVSCPRALVGSFGGLADDQRCSPVPELPPTVNNHLTVGFATHHDSPGQASALSVMAAASIAQASRPCVSIICLAQDHGGHVGDSTLALFGTAPQVMRVTLSPGVGPTISATGAASVSYDLTHSTR